MTVRVQVGGFDLETIATVGDLEDSTIWRSGGYSGDYEASLTWAAPADFAAPWFHAGATVEITDDGARVWSGFLGDPQQGDTWSLTAFGWGAEAANYVSDSASGTNLNANVDAATANGAGFERYTNNLGTGVPVGDAVMLDEVLNVGAKIHGKVWWVSCGEISLQSEATDIDWIMAPDSTYLGTTDEEMVTRLVGRYVSAVDGDGNPTAYADVDDEDTAAAAKFRPHERVLDLTPLGLITAGQAGDYTADRFAQVGARAGYTNGFTMSELNSTDVRSIPNPMGVQAGHRVQLSGLTDMRTGVTYLAAVVVTLGKVRHRRKERISLCEPLGLVARDFQGALAAAQPKKTGVMEL